MNEGLKRIDIRMIVALGGLALLSLSACSSASAAVEDSIRTYGDKYRFHVRVEKGEKWPGALHYYTDEKPVWEGDGRGGLRLVAKNVYCPVEVNYRSDYNAEEHINLLRYVGCEPFTPELTIATPLEITITE